MRRRSDITGAKSISMLCRPPPLRKVFRARSTRTETSEVSGIPEGARVDAPDIQQVADQDAHVVGLLVDDVEDLHDFGRTEIRRCAQRGRR